MAKRGLQHRALHRRERDANIGWRRRDPVFAVPRLRGRRRRQQPVFGGRDLLARFDHSVGKTRLEGRFARKPAAFQKERHRGLDPDETRQPLSSAGAWKQPHQGLGKTDRRVFVAGQHAVVRGEREFAAAPQRQARDRGGDRLGRKFPRRAARG